MADPATEDRLVKQAMAEGDPAAEEPVYVAQYKLIGETKIPISVEAGKLWNSRKAQSLESQRRTGVRDAWEETIRYYRNDQSTTRDQNDPLAHRFSRKRSHASDKWTETENIVFSNVSALVPALYAKNPDSEITFSSPALEGISKTLEKLLDTLAARKTAPGLNIKPKMRRAVVMSTLTNLSYIESGWTRKEDSSEETLSNIGILSQQLAAAKDIKEIQRIEGELLALERKVAVLRPSGPWVRFRTCFDVLVDPDSEEQDHSDAQWIMIRDMLPTEMLNALYGNRDAESGEVKSTYEPTHVLRLGPQGLGGHDDPNSAGMIFDSDTTRAYESYGYKDEQSYRAACRTCVWYVWDKVCRRVYLYADQDWKWPLWVWQDPYGFPDFFPITAVAFSTDPISTYARSEVMYYLDQQDRINDINTEAKKIIDWAAGRYAYDKKAFPDRQVIEKFIKGTSDDKVIGVEVPDGTDPTKLIFAISAPSERIVPFLQEQKQSLMQTVDRLSGVTNVMRGAEFKTNTTNKAIDTYESQTQTRIDEKMDAIEDALGDVFTKVAFLCLQFMPPETVAELIGAEYAANWVQMSPTEITQALSIRITGGSTLKPTSRVKKEMAMNIAQILGQFTSATPMAFYFALKAFERAFSDDFVITPEEWTTLTDSLQQAIAGGGGGGAPGPGQAPGGSAPAEGNAPPDADAGDASGLDGMMQQAEQIFDNAPPQAKQALAAMVAKGVPLKQIVAQVANAVRGGQSQGA